MGYAPPSYEELPLPTPEQFYKNPEYYWQKLEDYKNKPRLFGVLDVPKFLAKLIRR